MTLKSQRNRVHSSSNDKCGAVFAVNPFWGFATACPGLARGRIAVFGCDFADSFGGA
jgi:hypothetical protein